MKICLFTPSFLPKLGGLETAVDRLARTFQSSGQEVFVLAKTPRRGARNLDLPYELVFYPRTKSNVWMLGAVRRALRDEHLKRKFDIIHSHAIYPTGYVAVKSRDALGTPVVVTSHAGDVRRFADRFFTGRRLRWTVLHADAVTAVSENLKTRLDELTGNRTISAVIPNGVDPPSENTVLLPTKFAFLVEKPFVLTLGRLHRHKGLDVLLRALSSLRDQHRSPPYLVIAGEGKEGPRLKHLVRELELTENVRFVGNVFGEDKEWLLQNCRFFIQPSREEGMPLTILEAMARSKAVIGTKISGIEELVRDGENGLLVDPDSIRALAEAIQKLLSCDDLKQLEQQSRATADQMSWSTIARQYLSLFEDATCRQRSGPRTGSSQI